jgi:2',3'-cyclic-nucleotide 2'-phosphodiesterase (5'-nucleotidase family)
VTTLPCVWNVTLGKLKVLCGTPQVAAARRQTHLKTHPKMKPLRLCNTQPVPPWIRAKRLLATVAMFFTFASQASAAPILRITEVMSNGDTADWIELTNYGDQAANITGYHLDDNSFSVAVAVPLQGVTSVAPGESVLFVEGTSTTAATFRTNWSLAPEKQVGYYSGSGVGLSSGGDGVTLFTNSSANGGTELTGPFGGLIRVSFGAATTGTTFNWTYFASGASSSPASGQLTTSGTTWLNGATNMLGTPGTAVVTPATSVSIAAASVLEGNSGTVQLLLPVTRTSTTSAFTVNYAVTGGTATAGIDYEALTPGTLTFTAGGAASQNITLNVYGDTVIESNETITVTLSNLVVTSGEAALGTNSASGTITNDDTVALTYPPTNAITSTVKGHIGLAGAEIPAFDPASKRAFTSSGTGIQVVDLTSPATPVFLSTIVPSSLGISGLVSDDVSSISLRKANGANPAVLAAAIINNPKTANGHVVFLNAATGTVIGSTTCGVVPDHIAWTPDGTKLLVCNEGELAGTAASIPDAALGTVSIISVDAAGVPTTTATADFTSFDAPATIASLKASGVRLFGPAAVPSTDFEPEYLAISPDGTKAMVTLQEANAVAVLDIATATFTSVVPLGKKNFSTGRHDFSDRDGAGSTQLVNPTTGAPVFGLYMPDAIASYAFNGQTYYVTANEGDDRNDFLDPDETTTVSNAGYVLDPTVFPNAAALKNNASLGRLTVSNYPGLRGDTDGDGDIDEILSYGGRSFSIHDSAGNRVFDSGDMLEMIIASQHLSNFDDGRSDNKGPEPEGITVANLGGRNYAFVGLERSHMTLVFDVTNPAAVTYTTTLLRSGDLNPEGLVVVPAADSPTGKPLVLVASEVSNTLSVFELTPQIDYTLQLLHLADGEAGLLAAQTAPNLAALVDAYDGHYPNTLILAGGDNWIPGPFLNAGTDPSVRSALNTASGSTISLAASTNHPIAAVDIAIHNVIGVEASTIGNHEFDLGSRVFRDSFTPASVTGWVGANFPHLSANLDFSGDADLSPRFTAVPINGTTTAVPDASTVKGRIVPTAVITKGGEKIGLIGVTTQLLEGISSPSGTEVLGFPTGPGPNGEVDNMDLLATQIQPYINELIAEGVDKIVLMSHLQQLANEQSLATKLSGVDVILAAGSNTRLGDANDVPVAFPGHAATFADTYPLLTSGMDGKPTLIVNTDNEYTYVGRLVVDFDANGEIIVANLANNTAINGAYAATAANVASAWGVTEVDLPTTAFATGTKGAKVKSMTDAVQNVILVKDGTLFGYTDVYLEGERVVVRNQETNLGNMTADSMVSVGQIADPTAAFVAAFKNGGGIRAQIGAVDVATGNKLPPVANPAAGKPAGAISLLDIENSLRFNNRLMICDTTPAGLKAILEHGVALLGNQGRFPQIGGVRFSFDSTLTAGSRVRSIVLIDDTGATVARVMADGALLPTAPALISVVTLNFLAQGGDGYPFKANADNFRYLLDNGTLTAAVDESLDFSASVNVPSNTLGEQAALGTHLAANHSTPATAYALADTPIPQDTRIVQLSQNGGIDTVNSPVLAFELANVSVGKDQPSVTLNVLRTAGSSIATTAVISTTDGTAVSGVEYSGLTSQTVSFGAGVNSVPVTINLSAASITEAKTFTATLGTVTGGASLGTPSTVTVRIKADITPPTVAITTPKPNVVIKEPSTPTAAVVISGTINGGAGAPDLAGVSISVNGGSPVATTVDSMKKSWLLTLTGATAANAVLTAGNNTIVATAVDNEGNQGMSPPITVKYVKLRPLSVVAVNGAVMFSPALATGGLAEVGRAYTVTARPNRGYFFSTWAGSASYTTTSGNPTSFTFAEGNSVEAVFIASPFVAGSVAGTYNGVVQGNTAPTDTQANAGLLTIAVTAPSGAFSARVNLDGTLNTARGVFNPFTFAYTSPNNDDGLNYALSLEIPNSKITGTITKKVAGVAEVVMDVDAPLTYSTAVPPPAAQVAIYNAAFSVPTAALSLTADKYPHGNGYGVLTITDRGAARLTGYLADGRTFSSSAYLGRDGTVPVYDSFTGKIGTLVGTATLADETDSDVTGTDMRWFLGAHTGQYYPLGYTDGLTMNLVGAKRVPGLVTTLALTSSAQLTLSEGPFSATPVTKVLATSSTTATSKSYTPALPDKSAKISFNLTTGLMTIDHTPTGGLKHSGKGIIVGKGSTAEAYGYILSPLVRPADGTGQGGLVEVTP